MEGMKIFVTEPEKTLIDAAARPDLCGGIVHLAQVLKANEQSINWKKLDQYLLKWGGGTVVKRLGFLVENLGISVPDDILFHWKCVYHFIYS